MIRACRRWFVLVGALSTPVFAAPPEAPSKAPAETGWKAGVATAVITPEKPLWMAGYGGRTAPAEGKEHELYLKAVALEAADGGTVLFVSSDLLGFPQTMYEYAVKEIAAKYGLDRSRVRLTSSHTHCGPVLRGTLFDVYPLDAAQRAAIEEYSATLERKIVELAGAALADRKPARVSIGSSTCRFAVNRRENPEAEVPALRTRGRLDGPIDHSVPVLAVRAAGGADDGALRAVLFGYACHNTVLAYQQWCGDYAGFAQLELEQRHPGAVALFHMGCGADQNPLPRRSVDLAKNYGRMLADAVDDVLWSPAKNVAPKLRTADEMVELALAAPPSVTELTALAPDKSYVGAWARRQLAERSAGKEPFRTYPFPVQVWRLGDEPPWVALGGEVVVDYSLRIKNEIDPNAWTTAYANDVMAYIPSRRVLHEGGYEGNTSMRIYGMPS
ncbi:MAG: neutral/alkaline non-lysosomal ceramidase N-terminal domain-containing protein, partial [Planctomycetia bacterium]